MEIHLQRDELSQNFRLGVSPSALYLIFRSYIHFLYLRQSANGRLGQKIGDIARVGDAPMPCQLRMAPGVSIVSLAAAGMSFFALDSRGSVHVWGTLDGTSLALQRDGFSEPRKTSPTPLKLDMPAPTRIISTGRLHATTLDGNGDVWTFLSWGRPFKLVASSLDHPFNLSTPLRVESGWTFSSVLTASGDVFVWWPFSEEIEAIVTQQESILAESDDKVYATADQTIPCTTWTLQKDPFQLPPLPSDLPRRETSPISLIKIAALEQSLIGLTNHGHLLKFELTSEENVQSERWKYLPFFCETQRIKEKFGEQGLEPPQEVRITHITAKFQTFVAYSTGSSSVVLMGYSSTAPDEAPRILPALQNINIISVVLGDYHYGALTSTGKLLTWGGFSRGALGLGDPTKIEVGQPGGYRTERDRLTAQTNGGPYPPVVTEPTEVRFDHGYKRKRDMFCFAVTAAGWHMGALVIDMEHRKEAEDDSDEGVSMPGGFPSDRGQSDSPTNYPAEPGTWGHGFNPVGGTPFRVGFAGRGLRGGHRGLTIRGMQSRGRGEPLP